MHPLLCPPRSPCSRSCWSYQGSSSSAEKSSIPAALRMAPTGGAGQALRRRGSGPGLRARDNAAEAGRASRVAHSGCGDPSRAAPPRHPPPVGRPPGAWRVSGHARPGIGGAGGAEPQLHKGWRGGDGGRDGSKEGRGRREVRGVSSAREPRCAPPTRLRTAPSRVRQATPRAAAAS